MDDHHPGADARQLPGQGLQLGFQRQQLGIGIADRARQQAAQRRPVAHPLQRVDLLLPRVERGGQQHQAGDAPGMVGRHPRHHRAAQRVAQQHHRPAVGGQQRDHRSGLLGQAGQRAIGPALAKAGAVQRHHLQAGRRVQQVIGP